jgi:hypothetical protein
VCVAPRHEEIKVNVHIFLSSVVGGALSSAELPMK